MQPSDWSAGRRSAAKARRSHLSRLAGRLHADEIVRRGSQSRCSGVADCGRDTACACGRRNRSARPSPSMEHGGQQLGSLHGSGVTGDSEIAEWPTGGATTDRSLAPTRVPESSVRTVVGRGLAESGVLPLYIDIPNGRSVSHGQAPCCPSPSSTHLLLLRHPPFSLRLVAGIHTPGALWVLVSDTARPFVRDPGTQPYRSRSHTDEIEIEDSLRPRLRRRVSTPRCLSASAFFARLPGHAPRRAFPSPLTAALPARRSSCFSGSRARYAAIAFL